MKNIPKTLIVDLSKGYGGISSRVLSLSAALPNNSVAIAGINSGLVTIAAKEQGIPYYCVGRDKLDPSIHKNLVKVIKEGAFQVVDSQSTPSKFWSALAASSTDTALVSTLNSLSRDEFGNNLHGRFYELVERSTNHNLDHYITVSARDLIKVCEWGIPQEMVSVILNVAELDINSIGGSREWLLKYFNLPENAIVAVAAGRLVWQKGYPDLVNAIKIIAERQPRFHCLIAGDGRLRKSITEQINHSGLSDRIHLAGHHKRAEVLAMVKHADMFLMPSRYEGTPVALLEAAALSKPIVAAQAGGIPEQVRHEKEALLVEIGDFVSLAHCIEKFCNDPDYAAALGNNAMHHVKSTFTITEQARLTAAAYRKAWQHFEERLYKSVHKL
jgi:glycosyltransferase involved in cell wall biosynthesis